jgi:hypothetical protein
MMNGVRFAMLAVSLAVSCLMNGAAAQTFTIAVIPDTQNYVDFNNQTGQGFPFDARDQFFGQMAFLAARAKSAGGDIVFVTAVGDLWQHQSLPIDPVAEAKGLRRAENAFWAPLLGPRRETLTVEIPAVVKGYRLIADKIPFSVVPGNHDFDAVWTDRALADARGATYANAGTLHSGGLSNFISAFSEESVFFKEKAWYVASHDHGADSAQVFAAGGYRVLHIGLQFDPPSASLDWAAQVMARYPGLPTIITTHDFLDARGGRTTDTIADNHAADPDAHTPEMLWDALISRHDQIFMVLSGHRSNAHRSDLNRFGHRVYQLASDYQGRGQSAAEAGRPGVQTGDGWLRLMQFDMSATPRLHVRTYSPHYGKFSTDLPQYADWYRAEIRPGDLDAQFLAESDFVIDMVDFRERFGKPGRGR